MLHDKETVGTCGILTNVDILHVFLAFTSFGTVFLQLGDGIEVPKKVAFDNPKLNVLYYIFHLPIIAYVAWMHPNPAFALSWGELSPASRGSGDLCISETVL